jgi:steroid 5-alpha reductase family enzyme
MTWTLQGLWVSLCSMCALTAISSDTGVSANALFYVGLGLFIYGFCTEIVADKQKSKFRAIPENRDKFITTGLWAKFETSKLLWRNSFMVSRSLDVIFFFTRTSIYNAHLTHLHIHTFSLCERSKNA